MILYDDEDKDDAVIDEEKFYCAGVRRSIWDIIPVATLEPQWDNDKSYLQLRMKM